MKPKKLTSKLRVKTETDWVSILNQACCPTKPEIIQINDDSNQEHQLSEEPQQHTNYCKHQCCSEGHSVLKMVYKTYLDTIIR